MSRSVRKPVATQGYGGLARKFFKKQANKRVRKYQSDMSEGGYFKKVSKMSYLICDYKFYLDEFPRDEKMLKKFSRK